MSPEQASSDVISTASDIYSLGIIIQELFSNQSAYPVMETKQLLQDVQLANRLPTKGIPSPIRSLINKLCQLSAEQRPSALEVANEIEKIKLAPKTRKRKLIQVVIILSLLALITASVFQWLKFNNHQKSSVLTESYTQTINHLVKDAQQIYVLPIHNVQTEIAIIYQQAEKLFAEIENDPGLNDKDKIRLQGLIFLEAEEFELAVELLEQVQADHYLLARAWMALYIEKAGEQADTYGVEQTLNNKSFREEFLEPALKYIQKSTQNDEVMHAFKISQTQSLEQGIVLLDDVLAKQKWNKNAIQLKSQILMAQAENSLQKGNWPQALEYYYQTATTFGKAIQMARSYPENYYGLCNVSAIMLFDGVNRTGLNIEENSQTAIQACENYLITIPEDPEAMNLLARIHLLIGQWNHAIGNSGSDSIKMAEMWNQKSLLESNEMSNYWTLALIHSVTARNLINTGNQAQEEIKSALKAYKQATDSTNNPPAYLLADQIYTYGLQAEINLHKSLAIDEDILKADQLYQKAMTNNSLDVSQKRFLNINISSVYYIQLIEQFLLGKDITNDAEQLISFYQQTSKDTINEPLIFINLANVQLLLTEYNIDNNIEFSSHIDSIQSNLFKAQEVNATSPTLLISLARLSSLKARSLDHNFTITNQRFQKLIETNSNHAEAYYYWAKSLISQLEFTTSKIEKAKLTKMAIKKIDSALEINSSNKQFIKIKNYLINLSN